MATAFQKILAKIQALLQKTVENGCTEGEAMSALAKARALMNEYEVTESDLTFGGEQAKVNTQPKRDPYDVRARLCDGVGKFCGCRAFRNGIERVAFVGLYAETVFAHWLLDTLERFVDRECQNYLQANPVHGIRPEARRREIRGFTWACADRIAQRLRELAPPATDIVVKKNELIDAALAQAGIKLRDHFRLKKVDPQASNAGTAAGNRARFDKPMGPSTGTAPLLGGTRLNVGTE